MSRTQRYFITGVLTCLPFISLGLSQSTFGSITGSVKDPTGSVVPAADVEVTNDGTGATRRVTTSSAGVFNVPNLDLGSVQYTPPIVEATEAGRVVYRTSASGRVTFALTPELAGQIRTLVKGKAISQARNLILQAQHSLNMVSF